MFSSFSKHSFRQKFVKSGSGRGTTSHPQAAALLRVKKYSTKKFGEQVNKRQNHKICLTLINLLCSDRLNEPQRFWDLQIKGRCFGDKQQLSNKKKLIIQYPVNKYLNYFNYPSFENIALCSLSAGFQT